MAHSHERGISRVTFVDRGPSRRKQASFRVESSPFCECTPAVSRDAPPRFHARDAGQSLKIIKIKSPSPSRPPRGGTSEIVAECASRARNPRVHSRAEPALVKHILGGSVLMSISLTPRRASSIVQRFVHTSN